MEESIKVKIEYSGKVYTFTVHPFDVTTTEEAVEINDLAVRSFILGLLYVVTGKLHGANNF